MIIQQIVFFVFCCSLLGVLLWMLYRLRSTVMSILFALSLFTLLAFFLLFFGKLDSFTVKGLTAEATFIQRKSQQIADDAQIIENLRREFQQLLSDSKAKQERLDLFINATAAQFRESCQPWTTNITIGACQTATMVRAWGQLARIELTGPATLTADLSSWPTEQVVRLETVIFTDTHSLTLDSRRLVLSPSIRRSTNSMSSIIWERSLGQDFFKGY